MRKMKRMGYMAVVSVLLLAMLAACSSSKDKGSDAKETTSPAVSQQAQATDSGAASDDQHTAPFKDGKYEPAIQMTFVPCTTDDVKYYNGETASDNILYKKTKENVGIAFKTLWTAPTKNDACKTKMLLSLSANETLPDIFSSTDMDLVSKLIDSGRFMDITEAFDKYATPDIKRILSENPEIAYPVMRDGRMMALPLPIFGPNNPPTMYIRQDWLDHLNMKAPTTIDEFEQLMDAFVNQDPDGNNKNDTIGLAVELKNFIMNDKDALADSTALFGAYGIVPGIWEKSQDGQSLVYDSIQPGMKQALAKFREWMDKGYISKDAAQMDGAAAQELIVSGKAGIIFGPNWYPYWPFPDAIKVNPQAVFTPYPVPAGPDGTAKRRTNSLTGGAVLINKDYQHPDAVFEYAQKMFEYGNAGEYWGMNRETLIAQGYVHEGVPLQPVTYGPMNYFVDPFEAVNTYLNIMMKDKPAENAAQQARIDSCKSNPLCMNGQVPAYQVWETQKDIDVTNLYLGPPTETMKTKKDFLDKLEYETFTKIIYGSADLDEFDKFVEKWKSSGGDQVTSEVNEWYSKIRK